MARDIAGWYIAAGPLFIVLGKFPIIEPAVGEVAYKVRFLPGQLAQLNYLSATIVGNNTRVESQYHGSLNAIRLEKARVGFRKLRASINRTRFAVRFSNAVIT